MKWATARWVVVVFGSGAILAGCREPTEVDPATEIVAASLDSTHVDVAFRESLDSWTMTRPDNYRIRYAGASGAAIAVRSVVMADSVRGRAVRIETEPVPDAVAILIEVRDIRLLAGTRVGTKEVTVELVTGLSYLKDIAPLFASHCNSCHSGATPGGSYNTDSYFALFGSGTAPPADLIPGDPRCLLITKCLPRGAMFWTGKLETIQGDIVKDWVTTYQARQ